MRIKVLTIFPEMLRAMLSESILGRAIQGGKLDVELIDIRPYAENKHKNTDDYPFGGGAGMVMLAQPIVSAMEANTGPDFRGRRIYMSPRGRTLTQQIVEELSREEELVLLCGHYEGVDQRALDLCIDEELSIGDYVLTGGELAALVVIDSVSRLLPGVLGSAESAQDESFTTGLLEYPQYTRPREFRGMAVPEVLLNGNHAHITKWRREQALETTLRYRPEMLESAPLDPADRAFLQELRKRMEKAKEEKSMASKVYFTSMRTVGNENITAKLVRLCREAGIEKIDFQNKFTAVKMHFGEQGNLAFLRADYARSVVDLIKSLGGKPFVTDCSTLYVGARKNALDHLDVAYQHGFNPLSLGCHTIIADGLKGDDYVEVPIDGEYVKRAKIGRAIMDADVFVSLTHFKGHEGTGFGGALKNIGMGCGSSAGKAEMHMDEKPEPDAAECVGCGVCAENCAHSAIAISEGKASIDYEKCVGCGRCIGVCPTKAMRPSKENACELLSRRVTEYAYAVCKDRPCFHISLIIDVSPYCDCYPLNDAPVIPDVGMLASFDPVALDKACADLCNQQQAVGDSFLGEALRHGCSCHDHFHAMHPETQWEAGIEQGVKLGLGSDQYELITI